MKIEPVGFLSTHNVEGPFKLQFHKTREEIYTDTCLRIDAVYTETQMRQLVEACAVTAWNTGMDLHMKQHDSREVGSAGAAAIRELIKELLP